MRRDKTREQAGKIRERTGRKKMRPPPLSAKEEESKQPSDLFFSSAYINEKNPALYSICAVFLLVCFQKNNCR